MHPPRRAATQQGYKLFRGGQGYHGKTRKEADSLAPPLRFCTRTRRRRGITRQHVGKRRAGYHCTRPGWGSRWRRPNSGSATSRGGPTIPSERLPQTQTPVLD